MTRREYQMTAEDIHHGKRGDCDACPVALTILRTDGLQDVDVTGCGVVLGVEEDGTQIEARYPQEVESFISGFDRGGVNMKPIAFALEWHMAGGGGR